MKERHSKARVRWETPVNIYLDNLRLINAGAGAIIQDSFKISSIERNADD